MTTLSGALGCCGRQDDSAPDNWAYFGQAPPTSTPQVFAPGIISRVGFQLHSSLAISPTGDEVYFSKLGPDPESQTTICQIRHEGDAWTDVRTAPFSGVYSDDSPVFSPDGTTLFFSSTRPTYEGDESDDLNIWFVERDGDEWGEPEYAGDVLNSNHSDFRLSFASDGTIYLSSDRDDQGKLNFDVYQSPLAAGIYGTPEKMDTTINTAVTEQICYVAPDQSHMVFYRYDRQNTDATGIYISFRDEAGRWGTSANMGEVFNYPPDAVTQAASLSPDGKYLFFLRRRHEAIYWVAVSALDKLKRN